MASIGTSLAIGSSHTSNGGVEDRFQHETDFERARAKVRFRGDTVAKVENCVSPNFGGTLKREAIDDSDNLSRVTEVAYEFSVRR